VIELRILLARREPEIGVSMMCRHEPIDLNVCSIEKKSGLRCGTRIPCEIPATLTSLDPAQRYSDGCLIILVNPQGCAARFGRPLEIGAAVRLEGLPAITDVTARLLGLALDEPGNVWGIQSPPADWAP